MYVSCKWQYHFILYLVDSTVLDAVQYSCIQEETPHSSDTNDTSTNVSITTYRNKNNIHCQNKFLQKPVCARLLLVDGWMLGQVRWISSNLMVGTSFQTIYDHGGKLVA